MITYDRVTDYDIPFWESLTSIGTVGAVIMTLFILSYNEGKLKEKIQIGLAQEIYWNYYSLFYGDTSEIVFDKSQYEAFKSNLHLFSTKTIDRKGNILHDLYRYFLHFEFAWNKTGIGSYYLGEIKFRILVKILEFLDMGDETELTNILSNIITIDKDSNYYKWMMNEGSYKYSKNNIFKNKKFRNLLWEKAVEVKGARVRQSKKSKMYVSKKQIENEKIDNLTKVFQKYLQSKYEFKKSISSISIKRKMESLV